MIHVRKIVSKPVEYRLKSGDRRILVPAIFKYEFTDITDPIDLFEESQFRAFDVHLHGIELIQR